MKLKWGKKTPEAIRLDDDKMTAEAVALEAGLAKKVIDQDRAIKQFVRAYEVWQTGLNPPDKPLANLLFLGPTGVGKTHLVEVFCDELWGAHDMLLKVDCSEYQHSHETAKLIGSPPGYVGYNTGAARLSQEALEGHWRTSKGPKISVILFDEIEKAHPDFFQLILGLLDKGSITLGNGIKLDMRKCVVVMTSNLGAKDVSKHLNEGGIGFLRSSSRDSTDQKIYETAMKEVKKHFQPEFINRLDRIVVFRSLTDTGLRSILDLELGKVQDRLLSIGKFILLDVSQRAKDFLLAEGTNAEYGARELRRTIERFLVSRVTRVVATEQAKSGDIILADYDPDEKKMTFHLQAGVVDLPPDLNFSVTDLSKIPVSDGKQTLVSPRRTDPSSGDGTARAKIGPPIGSRNESGKCTACGAPWTIFHYCDKRRSELYGKRWGKCGLGEPMSGCDCIACRVIRKSMEREGKKWPPEQ